MKSGTREVNGIMIVKLARDSVAGYCGVALPGGGNDCARRATFEVHVTATEHPRRCESHAESLARLVGNR